MYKRRCLSCYLIKESREFIGRGTICRVCMGTSKEINKYPKQSKQQKIKKKNTTDHISSSTDRSTTNKIKTELKGTLNKLDTCESTSKIIDRIFLLAEKTHLKELPLLDIDFSEITEDELLHNYSEDDLVFIQETLERCFEKKNYKDYINPLEVIEKYKNGANEKDKQEEAKIVDKFWRKNIPKMLKQKIPTWNSDSLETFYFKAREIMIGYRGKDLDRIRAYVCDLSRIVFYQDEVEEELDVFETDDDISSAILSLVEAIILPHHEVLERIENLGGQILFSDIWTQPFGDALKKEVKDRDKWSCVICDSDKGLHVHHKIPRKFGGINHKDNLVTLCDSCHPAIETADIKHAFKKCLANYKKNRSKQLVKPVSVNKSQLKQEVESSLDYLVVALSNRNEDKLIEEVLGVMHRLEVIFYD